MPNRTGIVGIGESSYQPISEDSLEEIIQSASSSALADAGLERDEVESVVVCATDLEDGRAVSSMVGGSPAGAYNKDFIKTTDTGVHALALAAMRIESGKFDSTLVVSWSKQSEGDEAMIRSLEAEPFYHRGSGLGYRSGHALEAADFADRHPDAHAAAGQIVEKNTQNGTDASVGHRDAVKTADQVAESDIVAWPFREAHLPEASDGACAVVVAAEDLAKEQRDRPVWIDGLGWESGPYSLGKRFPQTQATIERAAERAYDEAGLNPDAIDVFESQTPSAYHELIACDGLGVTQEPVVECALDGGLTRDSDTPVNPSGGPFAANPLLATGLARVIAAAKQVRGDADGVQVPDIRRAVAHSAGSYVNQIHGVAVLGGEPA
jgi:acetyl-CoA acetyltransferase